MPRELPTRRRVLTIFAAAAAGSLAGPGGLAASDYEWRGTAMGADARILFDGIEPQRARRLTIAIEAEIDRLESALSLFRPDSELRRLNRDGHIGQPSGDLRRAVALALRIADRTGGLFDPTVQALWEAHVDWFADGRTTLPPDGAIAKARRFVDWRKVRLTSDALALAEGQRLTLNGLGQGYVTDRVAELLAMNGLTNVLVDLGEQRALSPRRDGSPWLIARPDAVPIRLAQGALATSEGSGCILGADGEAHHLFDPRSGRSAAHWRTMTVHHASAAFADALSTAFSIASADEIEALLAQLNGITISAVDRHGHHRQWRSNPADSIIG